ncbi:MAG: hypothetical protein AAGF59_14605 [Pseudomonadota bacterium]
MFHMLSCFNLKPGIDIDVFHRLYAEFVETMREAGLVESSGPVGRRQNDTPMDTDDERDHEFFSVMTFKDRPQVDAAYAYLTERSEPAQSAHFGIFRWVEKPVFICWQDLPETPSQIQARNAEMT